MCLPKFFLFADFEFNLQEHNWEEFSEIVLFSPQEDEITLEAEQFACRMLSFDNSEFLGETHSDKIEENTKIISHVRQCMFLLCRSQIFNLLRRK